MRARGRGDSAMSVTDSERPKPLTKQINEIYILGSACAKHNTIEHKVGMLRGKNVIKRMRVTDAGLGSGDGGDVRGIRTTHLLHGL